MGPEARARRWWIKDEDTILRREVNLQCRILVMTRELPSFADLYECSESGVIE